MYKNNISFKSIVCFGFVFLLSVFMYEEYIGWRIKQQLEVNVIIINFINPIFISLLLSILFFIFKDIRESIVKKFTIKNVDIGESIKDILISLFVLGTTAWYISTIPQTVPIEDKEIITLSSVGVILTLLNTIFLAPIFEELFFRAVLLDKMTEKYPVVFSNVLTTVIFVTLHREATPLGYVMLFTLSITLGVVYRKHRSIIIPIVVHSLYNANIVIFGFL